MEPQFTTSDFVRPYREDLKGGYVLETEPVIEDGKTVTFMYTFMNYRSGELCRYAEGDLKKSREPRDYDHPERIRVKPLAVGDKVFDRSKHLVAVITQILPNGVVVLSQKDTLKYNRLFFDPIPETNGYAWKVLFPTDIYQFVPDRVDSREKMPVCYEHINTQDNYPYYSPYLNENLFLCETERPAADQPVPAFTTKKEEPRKDVPEAQPEQPEAFIPLAPAGSEETIQVRLTPGIFPTAFKAKLEELIGQGMTEEDARRWILSTPIVLELYYEKDSGLFAVESEALESCPESIRSPYSGVPFKETEENK